MADVTGISVDIGNVIAKAQEADKAIETLAKNGIKNLNDLSDRGVKPLIEQFDKLISRLGSKSNGNADIKVNVDTSKAVNNIDEVNKAIKNINKGDASLSKGMEKEVRSSITELAKLTERVKEYEHRKKLASEGHQVQFVVGEQKDYVNNLKRIAELEQRLSEIRSSANLRGYALGFNAPTTSQKDREDYEAFLNNGFRKQLEERGKLIEQYGLTELRKISDSVEARKKASDEAAKIAQKEHDLKQKDYEEMGKEWDKIERARVKANEKATKEMIRNAERYQEMVRRGASAKGTALSSSQAMETVNYHANASSINQNLSAISALNNAKRNLNQNDKDYKKTLDAINNALLKHKTALFNAGVATGNFNSQNKSFMNTLGQLKGVISSVFAVTSVVNFLNKIVSVRGEFELQHKSLQVLLQDKDKADELWDKTVQLAVKSPFRVGELVKYTKQLAAYRVEADKLYETNKMLADVSAGLGVDMNRLILAFGQVKAANYLRGTELRQFSEAGINILKELADEYTKVEGRVVSVGDVFQRVSKRMVSFADVEKVFKRVTSAGGVFYKMQEQQAETTKGLMSNLKDTIDVALNEIGEANDGIVKGSIKAVTALLQQWEKLVPIIKVAGAAFVVYQVASYASSRATINHAKALGVANVQYGKTLTLQQLLILSTKRLGAAFASTKNSITGLFKGGNAWAIVIGAIIAGIGKIIKDHYDFQEKLKEIRDTYKDLKDEVSSISMDIKYSDKFEDKERKLKELAELAKNKYNIQVDLEMETDKKSLEQSAAEISNQINKQLRFSEWFAIEFEKFNRSGGDSVWDFGLVDDIKEDTEDFQKSSREILSSLEGNRHALAIALKNTGVKEAEDLSKIFYEGQRADENTLQYIQRMNEAYNQIKKIVNSSLISGTYDKFTEVTKYTSGLGWFNFERDYDRAKTEYANLFSQIRDRVVSLDEAEKASTIKKAIDGVAKNYDPIVKDLMYKLANEEFKINITPQVNTKPNELAKWQIEYNKLVDKLDVKEIHEVTAATDRDAYVNNLKGFYEDTQDIINKYETGVPEMLASFTEEEIAGLKKVNNARKQALAFFGVKIDKEEEKALKIVKSRISLIEDMHKKYLELRKYYSEEEAEEKVRESYKDLFIDAFKDTGIDLSSLVIDREKLYNLTEAGREAGKTFSEAMEAEMHDIAMKGTYIRDFTNEAAEFIKENEGKPILKAKDVEGLGKGYTLGYGEYGILRGSEGRKIKRGDEITQEQAEERLVTYLLPEKRKILNDILDKNKDLIFTQKQYNALLDLAFQGTKGGVEALFNRARDVSKGVEHITNMQIQISKLFGEETASRFGEAFVAKFREAESIYDRIAMLLEVANLTSGGEIRKGLYKGMQARSDKRSAMFTGDVEMVKMLQKASIDISQIDFTNIEGVVAVLKRLRPLAEKEGKAAKEALEAKISEFEATIGVDVRIKKAKELNDQVENLFSDYELSLELDKLGIPPDLASQLFGIDSISLPELRANLEAKRGEFIGTDQEDKYKEWLKKLSELEDKHRLENLKKYSKYLVKAQSERVKIKLEELRQIEEIESLSDADDSTKMRMREGVREETQKKLSDLEWNEFKASDMYIQIFEDLDNASNVALNSMIQRLSSMRENLKDLDATQLKEIVDAIGRAKDALAANDPFNAIASNMKKAKEFRMNKDEWSAQYISSYDSEAQLKRDTDSLTLSIQKTEATIAELEAQKDITEEDELTISALKNTLAYEKELLDTKLKELVAQGKITKEYAKQIQEGANAENAVAKGLDTISDIFGSLSKNIDELKEGLEGFGDIGAFGDILSIGSTLSSGAQGIVSSFKDFKDVGSIWNKDKDGNKSLNVGNLIGKVGGVMGIAGAAAQAVSSIINVGAAIHDARIEKEIQEEIKLVDKLGKQYENLEERIDEAYSIDKLNRANTMAKNNLEAQMDSYRKMIKLEEDKKKTDDARIKEWQEKIADAQEQLRELEEKYYEELGGFGSDLAYKDAATEFVDAWFDAFKETGNGLTGLQDKWDEYFNNIIKKQMLMRGVQTIIEPTLRTLDSMLSDGIMTEDEWNNIQKMSDSTNEKLNEYLSKFADRYGVLMDSDEADLTGLQRGIQSITEETANALQALLNSIRFFVADNNTQLKIIAGSYNTEDTPNPMLAQLKVIAAQTTAIRNLLDSVTFVHPRGGRGFKVVI